MSSFIHKKLKAFTLIELLVGMILSGIVVATCFNAYRIVSLQFKRFKETSSAYNSFSFFEAQLRNDIRKSKIISVPGENSIRLSGRQNIDWHFTEKYALRNDGTETDTFSVGSKYIELLAPGSDTTISIRVAVADHTCEIRCEKEHTALEQVQADFEKMTQDGN